MKALIPFRKGSERIKNKCVRKIMGIPLYEYTLDRAIQVLTDVIVATDYSVSDLIENGSGIVAMRNVSIYKREEVNSLQPATELFLELFNKGVLLESDDVCLLQPTCPIRLISDLENAIHIFEANRDAANTLVSVQEIDTLNKIYTKSEEGVFNSLTGNTGYDRFKSHKVYARNSSIYIFKMSFFLEKNSIFEQQPLVYVMPKERSIDIDVESDFIMVERLIKGGALEGDRGI